MVSFAGLLAFGTGRAFAQNNPAYGMPPMAAWYWGSTSHNVMFDYSGSFVAFPFPAVPSATSANWGGIDNPAPLLWYQQHVLANWAGTAFAGKYSTGLIAAMNGEHFNPAMVGGPSASSLTTPTNATWSDADSWVFPQGVNAAPTLKASYGKISLSNAAPTQSAPPAPKRSPNPTLHSTAPSVAPTVAIHIPAIHTTRTHSSVTTGAVSSMATKATARPASQQKVVKISGSAGTGLSKVAGTPRHPNPLQPVQPPDTHSVSYARYRQTLAADTARLHARNPVPKPVNPWPWAVGALIVLGGGGYGLWRWRQTRY